jgi:hypothetical protein
LSGKAISCISLLLSKLKQSVSPRDLDGSGIDTEGARVLDEWQRAEFKLLK